MQIAKANSYCFAGEEDDELRRNSIISFKKEEILRKTIENGEEIFDENYNEELRDFYNLERK